MNNIFRIFRIAALPLVVVGLVIIGCGDDDNPVGPKTKYYDNYIVYVASGGIAITQTDGSDRQIFVAGHADSLHSPIWSPRKTEVVYVRVTATGEEQIEIYRNDGSIDTLAMGMIDKSPWSPDGKKITYIRNDVVFVIGTDGSSEKTLMTPAVEANFLDNDHIVCMSTSFLQYCAIYKVSVDDGTSTQLFPPHYGNMRPRVMPDSGGVIFAQFDESPPYSRWNDFIKVNMDGPDADTITRINTSPTQTILVMEMDVSYNGDYILLIHNDLHANRNPYEIDITGKSWAIIDSVDCSCGIKSIDYAPDSRDFVFENETGGIAIFDRSTAQEIVLDPVGKHPNW